MATATAALRTPEDLANRYDRLTKSTGRTKTFYMTEALAAEISRLEYECGLMNYPGVSANLKLTTFANASRRMR